MTLPRLRAAVSVAFLTAVLLAASLTVTGTAPAAAAPAATIVVSLQDPQPDLSFDASQGTVRVTATISDCSHRCELWRMTRFRMSEGGALLATATSSPGATTLVGTDRYEDVLVDDLTYEVNVYDETGAYTNPVPVRDEGAPVRDEEAFHFSGVWRRDTNITVGGTMIRRSFTPGDSASFSVPPQETPGIDHRLGIVSARGPNNGVMRILVDGVARATLDLKAARWSPRQVVKVVPVRAGSTVTVINVTPAGRLQRDVHIDGVVLRGFGSGSRWIAGPYVPPNPLYAPSISVGPASGVTVPVGLSSMPVTITTTTHGCPAGCTVTKVTTTEDRVTRMPLAAWTSPATTSVETRRFTDALTGAPDVWSMYGDSYELSVGAAYPRGTEIVGKAGGGPFTTAPGASSEGWSVRSAPTALSGSLVVSTTAGAGVVSRIDGILASHEVGVVAVTGPAAGVLGVYVQGTLVKTVDLRTGSRQPRRVVATVRVPTRGLLTLVNRTPAGRTASTVELDSLVLFNVYDPGPW